MTPVRFQLALALGVQEQHAAAEALLKQVLVDASKHGFKDHPLEDQLGVSPLFQRRLRPGNNCGGALLLPVVVRVGRKFKKPTKV